VRDVQPAHQLGAELVARDGGAVELRVAGTNADISERLREATIGAFKGSKPSFHAEFRIQVRGGPWKWVYSQARARSPDATASVARRGSPAPSQRTNSLVHSHRARWSASRCPFRCWSGG